MKMIKVVLLSGALLACGFLPLQAGQPVLFDGFESYNVGTLDANLPAGQGGTNPGPNGGPGNAWWGPTLDIPALRVVNSETYTIPGAVTNMVSPHGGTNMVRGPGDFGMDFAEDFYNIAYRLNSGGAYSNNVVFDWWFFDPIGTNAGGGYSATDYQDFAALAFYDNMPTNADYALNADGFADPGFPLGQLSIGAAPAGSQGTGFQTNEYQAQVLGATNGYDRAGGWFNLTNTVRAVGWHHARIVVYPILTNTIASFFIDDMTHAGLTNSVVATNGFNCLMLQAEYQGVLTGYFDDLTFDIIPPPVLSVAKSGTNAVVSWPGLGWVLQTSTNLSTSSFVDVTNAASPYTNAVTAGPHFFRLRH